MLTKFEQSLEQVNLIQNWDYIHGLVSDKITFNIDELDPNYLSIIDNEISNFIQSQHVTEDLKRRRNGIIEHLKKVLTNKFEGSKLISFGEFEAGLNLFNEAIDLSLMFDGKLPKKALNKISRTLKEDGMDNVSMILTAKIPRVMFVDNKSRITIDLSVDNNLAIYNTDLLNKYIQIDNRVKPFILSIKQWAQNRGISNPVHGTFSSYSWTLIAINFLQRIRNPVLPNLLIGADSKTVEIDGFTFNVGISLPSDVNFSTSNKFTTGELFCQFLQDLAINWPWDENVISVKNGSLLSRKEKGWEQNLSKLTEGLSNNNSKSVGRYYMPVEDPFDSKHDLNALLNADGIMDIRNEVLRACHLISTKTSWTDLVAIKNHDLVPENPKLDLFEDLRSKDDSEIKIELEQLYSKLSEIEKHVSARESERNEAIKMSKALRKNAELAREQSNLSSELRPRRAKLNEVQSKRDSANNNYIPIHFIEEEMARVYTILTEETTNKVEINIEKEKNMFSWFFELQSMYEHSKKTREYHKEFLRLLNQQNNSVKHIKSLRDEMVVIKNLGKPTDFDDLAKRLLKELNPLKRERRFFRREIGRLESWLRSKNYDKSKPHKKSNTRNKRRGYKNSKVNDVKNKVVSGDSFSLQDLEILLKNGGLSSVNEKSKYNRQSNKRKKKSNKGISPQRVNRAKKTKQNN